MGRSLRRIKRRQPRIIKRKSKKPFTKSDVPQELTAQRPDIKNKLGLDAEWNEGTKTDKNYEQLGFLSDANAGFGRNKKTDQLASKRRRATEDNLGELEVGEEIEEDELDDDLNAAMAKVRKTGKANPKRITPHQRKIVESLINAHGDDVDKMAHDRKLNKMQHSKGYLTKLIESYHFWSEDSGQDFRVPNKRLW